MSRKGKYRFLRMPFRLKGAPPCFERLMDEILSDMPEFFRANRDDIVIFSETWEEHLCQASALTGCRAALKEQNKHVYVVVCVCVMV